MKTAIFCLTIILSSSIAGCHSYSFKSESDAASKWLATDITLYKQGQASAATQSTKRASSRSDVFVWSSL